MNRHLILDSDDQFVQVTIACSGQPEPYDRARHAVLAVAVSCHACLAVQAARIVVIDALAATDPGQP